MGVTMGAVRVVVVAVLVDVVGILMVVVVVVVLTVLPCLWLAGRPIKAGRLGRVVAVRPSMWVGMGAHPVAVQVAVDQFVGLGAHRLQK
jgi:hypothetical protein